MSDSTHPPSDSDLVELSVGQTLRSARESSGLSIEEVAERLKLTARQLNAIESDEFDSLPGNTFVRGFVRNYARLLGVDSRPLLDKLAAFLPAERVQAAMPYVGDATALASAATPGRQVRNWPLLLASALGLMIGVGGVFWYLQRPPEPDMSMTAMPVPAPDVASAVDSMVLVSEASDVMPEIEQASSPLPEMASVPVAASQPAITIQAPQAVASVVQPASFAAVRVTVAFDSWVQIVDAKGQTLVSQLMRQGMEQTVSGEPPYRIKIGNAPQTRLFYRGQPVDLAPHTRADVATLELK